MKSKFLHLLPISWLACIASAVCKVDWDDNSVVFEKLKLEIMIRTYLIGKIRTYWRILAYGNDWDDPKDIEKVFLENAIIPEVGET